jgi:hypothetical protein
METLTMRRKERPPVGIMASAKAGELNLLEAAELSGLGHRQTKRVWKRQAEPKPPGPGKTTSNQGDISNEFWRRGRISVSCRLFQSDSDRG